MFFSNSNLEEFCERLRHVPPPELEKESDDVLNNIFTFAKQQVSDKQSGFAPLESIVILSRIRRFWQSRPDDEIFGILLERFFSGDDDSDTRLSIMKSLANLPIINEDMTKKHFFAYATLFVEDVKHRSISCEMEDFLFCRILSLGSIVSQNFANAMVDCIDELCSWMVRAASPDHSNSNFQIRVLKELSKVLFVIFCQQEVSLNELNFQKIQLPISSLFSIISQSFNDQSTDLVDNLVQLLERLPDKFLKEAFDLPRDPLAPFETLYGKLDPFYEKFYRRVCGDTTFLADKGALLPFLKVLCSLTSCSRHARKRFQKLLSLEKRDYQKLPNDRNSFSGRLISLFTDTDVDVKTIAAQLFMIISKNKVQRFIDITGYGNAAGLLYTNNALSGESTFAQLDYASSDDEDLQRDIEIKNQADKIARNKEIANPEYNPTTGRIEPQKLDMFAGLSDEQREWEAHKIANLFCKLGDSGLQPMAVDADGKFKPVRELAAQVNLPSEHSESDSD